MKNLKFRAFNRFDGVLVKDIIFDRGCFSFNQFLSDEANGYKFELQMITPFTDKNGNDIYEGDIIYNERNSYMLVKFGKFDAGHDDYQINFQPVGWHIVFYDGGEYVLNDDDNNNYSINSKDSIIVGNIFETQTLLSEKQLTIK